MLHAMIGVTTEAIELLQNTISILNGRSAVKDYSNIVEEMGDIYWYLAVLQKATGISEEKVKSKNIMKLRARYPEKFTTDDALNRDLDKEAEALSDGEGN
jgi:NTP pyrophosphatase (non-canonical NTP hydrolase)